MDQLACTSGPSSDRTARSVNLHDLPTEMLWIVFSYLKWKDLVSACCVSSRWRDVGNGVPLMTGRLYNVTSHHSNHEVEKTFEVIPNIRNIRITPCKLKIESTLKSLLKYCTDIRVINIKGYLVIDPTLMQNVVKKFTNLESLKVPLGIHPQQITNQINACLELQELGLYNFHSDIDLKPIADGCPNLRHLDVSFCRYKKIDFIYLLQQKTHLQSLGFQCLCYAPNIAHTRNEFKYLKHVECSFTLKEMGGLIPEGISGLSELKRLDLHFCGKVSQYDAMGLSKCSFASTLTELNLMCRINIPQEFSRTIVSSLPNVERLRVDIAKGGGIEGLKYLLEMKKLKRLDIVKLRLCESLVENIVKCKQIKHLVLYRCIDLDDKKALRLVKEMDLRSLVISRCKYLTDEFLKSFPRCKTLREMYVDVVDPLYRTERKLRIRQPSTRITVHKYYDDV